VFLVNTYGTSAVLVSEINMKTILSILASLIMLGGGDIRKVQPQPQLQQTLDTFFVQWEEGVDKNSIISDISGIESVEHYSHIPNLTLIRMGKGNSIQTAMTALCINPNIKFVEADIVFTATRHEVIPNDVGFSQCWGHRNTGTSGGLVNFDMNTSNVWSITQGSPTVKILILETGIQQNHPDINQLVGRDFTTNVVNGIAGGEPSNSCDNHGTAVAGCVTGIINNSIGTVGVAPNCKVISAKVGTSITPCNGSWQGQTSWTVNAINWGIANGVRVTNNSNDYGTVSTAMVSAYTAARNAGVVNFASSGNSGNTTIGFPASTSSVNAVGASSRNGQKASFSSYGSKIAFVAAGQSIYTTDRTGTNGYGSGDYTTIDGTSFSSPYAAGVAALIISANPSLSAAQVETIMKNTCKDMGTVGFDTLTGWGMLNAEAAVIAASPLPCVSDLNGDRVVDGSDLGKLLSSWGTASSDITGDMTVDGQDLGVLLAAWGVCP
jgi:subtilisin family serine protease